MRGLTRTHKNLINGLGILLALTLCGAGVLSLGAAAAGPRSPGPVRTTSPATPAARPGIPDRAGQPVKASPAVTAPAAKWKPKAASRPVRTSTGPAEVAYADCAAVRAAGAAPIRRGDPGYRRELDRDGDGVACRR